jgi:hypothetical protein
MSFHAGANTQHRNWNLFIEGAAAPVPPVSLYVSTKFDGVAGSIADVPNLGSGGGAWNLKPGSGDQCVISAAQSKFYGTSLSLPATNIINGANCTLELPDPIFTDDTECSMGLWAYLDAAPGSNISFNLGAFNLLGGVSAGNVLLTTSAPSNSSTAFRMLVNSSLFTDTTRFNAREWLYIEVAQNAARQMSVRINGNLVFTHPTARLANQLSGYYIALTCGATTDSVFYANDIQVNQSAAFTPPYTPPGPLA